MIVECRFGRWMLWLMLVLWRSLIFWPLRFFRHITRAFLRKFKKRGAALKRFGYFFWPILVLAPSHFCVNCMCHRSAQVCVLTTCAVAVLMLWLVRNFLIMATPSWCTFSVLLKRDKRMMIAFSIQFRIEWRLTVYYFIFRYFLSIIRTRSPIQYTMPTLLTSCFSHVPSTAEWR